MRPSAQDAFYFLSAFLFFFRILRWVADRFLRGHSPWISAAVALAVTLGGSFYSRGLYGDISVSLTLCLLLDALKAFRTPCIERGWGRVNGMWIFVAAGLFLYPSSFYPMAWHAYGWGYPESGTYWVLCSFVVAAGIYWYQIKSPWMLVLPGALAAYTLRLLESDNLWDYLLDPILFIWAAGALLLALARKCRKG